MKRLIASAVLVSFAVMAVGCGEEKPAKPASGGGGATSPSTITVPPKGERPKMD
jgi:hypothetical protein